MLRTPTKRTKGFTLIEVVIAITIVGILSAVAIPNVWTAIQTIRVSNAAHKLASDIRYLREMSMSRHGTYGIDFTVANNSYSLFAWNGSTKAILNNPHSNKSMTIDFDIYPEFAGVTIASGGPTEVRFNSFGTPLDAFGNSLTSIQTITLQQGSLSKQIQITHQTGFVEVL